MAIGMSSELSLNGSGTTKHLSVHGFETLVGGVKHEPARHAHSDADGAAIIFDRETLGIHLTLLQWRAAAAGRARRPIGSLPDCESARARRSAAIWSSPKRARTKAGGLGR